MEYKFVNDFKALVQELVIYKKPLLIMSKNMMNQSKVDLLMNKVGLEFNFFDKFNSHPDLKSYNNYVEEFINKHNKSDCIVTIGGGSAIDAAKTYNLMAASNEGNIEKIILNQQNYDPNKILPLIACPTTVGSGSEVTQFATIWDHLNKRKLSLNNKKMLPTKIFYVLEALESIPYDVFLFSKLDSLGHATESVFSQNTNLDSLNFLRDFLKVTKSGFEIKLDSQSKTDYFKSSFYAGKAISITKTSLPHALSYPLTSNFLVPHGLAVGISLKVFWEKYKRRLKVDHDIIEGLDFLIYSINQTYLQKLLANFLTFEKIKNQNYFTEDVFEYMRSKNFSFDLEKETIKEIYIKSIAG